MSAPARRSAAASRRLAGVACVVDEQVGWLEIAGAMLVLGGVLLVTAPAARTPRSG